MKTACPDQGDLLAAHQSTTKREEVNAVRQHLQTAGGPDGLDYLFTSQSLDIIIAPGDAPLSSLAAAAGYPTAACPLSALKLNGQPLWSHPSVTTTHRAHVTPLPYCLRKHLSTTRIANAAEQCAVARPESGTAARSAYYRSHST